MQALMLVKIHRYKVCCKNAGVNVRRVCGCGMVVTLALNGAWLGAM